MNCRDLQSSMHLYLDGELQAPETLRVEAHLVECAACRREYESLLAVVESVRAAQPLYRAPDTSLAQVRGMVARHERRRTVWRLAVAASVLIAGSLAMVATRSSTGGPDSFASFAADMHVNYADGRLPLDVRDGSPGTVNRWLSRHLPTHPPLPNYPEGPGQTKKYSLVGARVLHYQQEDVAYVAYEMDSRPISLVMAAAERVTPSGGEVIQSGGLTFHTTSYKGLSIITWVDKDVAYALVSDLAAVGAESCVICHSGVQERRKFAPLRPRL